MVYRKFIIFTMMIALCGWMISPALAAEVVIKVRALNPLNSTETAVIKYPLPKKITLDAIKKQKITYSADHSGDEEPLKQEFNISFDEKRGEYFVDDEVVLLPKEVVTLEIHVNDVWVIDKTQIEGMKEEVDSLLNDWESQIQAKAEEVSPEEATEDPGEPEMVDEKTKEEETMEFALVMKSEIVKGLDEIIKRQDSNRIIDVGVEKHIEAYEDNIEDLRQVQQDIILLANLIQYDEGSGEEEAEETDGEPTEPAEPLEELPEIVPDIVQDETISDLEDLEGLASDAPNK